MARARYLRSLAGVGVVAAVLVTTLPDLPALADGMAAPERWVERDGLDIVLAQVVGVLAWLTALWLAAGFVLVAGSRLPGAAGRTSAVLARGALPAGLRRTAAVVLGAGLATSAASLSSGAAEGRGAPSAAASTSSAAPWPTGIDRIPARAALTDAATDERPATAPPAATADRPEDILDRDAPGGTAPAGTSLPPAATDRPAATAAPLRSATLPSEVVDRPAVGKSPEGAPPENGAAAASPAAVVDWPVQQTAREGAPTAALPARTVDWPAQRTARESAPTAALPARTVDWPAQRTARESAPTAALPAGLVEPAARQAVPTAALPAGEVDWPVASDGSSTPASVEWPPGRPAEPRPSVASRSVVFSPAEPVIVAPGDTLWSIASRRLGPGAPAPAIAIEWRRWHAANRQLIGSDPRRLRPGTVLTPPIPG